MPTLALANEASRTARDSLPRRLAHGRNRDSHRQFKHYGKSGRVTLPGKPGDDFAPGCLIQASGILDMSPRNDTARDEALRMVGRTVVNFQRLEHNLKLAARLGPLQGTAQKVQKDIARRQERASTLTLGQAIQAWLSFCHEEPATRYGTPDLFDVSVETTFTFESDAEAQASHAKDLRELLELRNALIHSRLAKFEWERPEACQELVAELEQVNALIAVQVEYTSSLLQAISEMLREHAQSLEELFADEAPSVAGTRPDAVPEQTR